MKKYRLGVDLGATSLGWSILELDDDNSPKGLIDLGVRIFPDGRDAKTSQPLNVTRREHRSMRRNRDRYLQRRAYLMDTLVKYGLMPKDEKERKELEHLDPYFLRAQALDRKITLYELGRVIFHLNQRRGFKSNRKLDSNNTEITKMGKAIEQVGANLGKDDTRTLGEYLYNLNKDKSSKEQVNRIPIRIRYFDKQYNLYTDRSMYKQEFEKIWKKQEEYHSELTDEKYNHLDKIIFTQRDLKKPKKGRCRLEPDEFRCPKAFPIVQQFRIYQEVNNLILLDFDRNEHELTNAQREIIVQTLLSQKTASFSGLRGKLGTRYDDYKFNLESEKRKNLKGDETAGILRSNKLFGKLWDKLTAEEQHNIISNLVNEDNINKIEDNLVNWLCSEYGFNSETAKKITEEPLPTGTSNLSLKAIKKILPFLKEGYRYYDAKVMAGYQDGKTGEVYDEGNLPYYGKIMEHHTMFSNKEHYTEDEPEQYYGKIANPTVHIALNQLRKFINALTKKYGAPAQIVIELSRKLPMGKDELKKLENEQTANTEDNERIKKELEDIGVENNYQNRLKYKLWEELDKNNAKKCCPYTGKPILLNPVDGLFSNKFEVDHILPKSRTFNNSMANKTVCYYAANRYKKERSPYEAFGNSPDGYDWEKILERGLRLPENKCWRFYPEAMKKFENENELIARLLNDTKYMSRVALEYMSFVCGEDNVWAIPGQLTAEIRKKWGLNELLSGENVKNRADHRHHAIDAFVVACTDEAMLRKVSNAIKTSHNKFIEKLPYPFSDFAFHEMQKKVDDIIVSYKPDHGNAKAAITDGKLKGKRKTVSQLHDATAYGCYNTNEENKTIDLTIRKDITSIEPKSKSYEIVDKSIRDELSELTGGKNKSEIKDLLKQYSNDTGIKRLKVRIKNKKQDTVVKIEDKYGNYKYYELQNNYCADIYCPDKGKKAGKWQIEIIPMFYAHQQDYEPEWHKKYPTAKKIMRLFKYDYVAYQEEGKRVIRRLKKMIVDGRLVFIDLNISKPEKKLSSTSVKQLQERNARKVGIDILGNISDPQRHEYNRDQKE